MMKTKFNHFERVAGLLVLSVLVGGIGVAVVVSIKKGWFESHITYWTELPSADGLHSGTEVQMQGLRIGSVDELTFQGASKVKVKFSISQKYQAQVRKDSRVTVIRPFIIGEKVIDLAVGSDNEEMLAEGETVLNTPSFDMMDLIGGRKLGPLLGTLEGLTSNLKILADAFSKTERTENFVKVVDQLLPLTVSMNQMAQETVKILKPMNSDKKVQILFNQVTQMTDELNKLMPTIAENTPQLIKSVVALTQAFEKLVPAINSVAPELPEASHRALQALDETVITLKALQKSFLMRGNVREVKEEEEKKRKPAGENEK
jgi:phospholipid/cholesterol/gamma-HCH transport system substrate-binding protein